jgi:hypothetical protein
MSTGNPKHNGLFLVKKKQEEKTIEQTAEKNKQKLPLFRALLDKNGVIVCISFTKEFYREMGISNPDQYSFTPEDKERIKKLTGKNLDELMDIMLRLADQYMGKKESPLEMEYYNP